MEPLQYYRAMEAFCRQRAKMEGEDESFWLTEAELLAKLSTKCEPHEGIYHEGIYYVTRGEDACHDLLDLQVHSILAKARSPIALTEMDGESWRGSSSHRDLIIQGGGSRTRISND